MKRGLRKFVRKVRPAYLLIAGFLALIAVSAAFEGPRAVYVNAIIICLDCIGLA